MSVRPRPLAERLSSPVCLATEAPTPLLPSRTETREAGKGHRSLLERLGMRAEMEATKRLSNLPASVILASLPWIAHDARNPQPARESVRKTSAILENISREPCVARASLLNNEGRPQYPESEWDNMLNGRAVNLDIVVSSEHSIEIDVKTSEKVGDFELVFTPSSSSATPSKVVKSHSDYIIAWDRTVAAYEFIFEHRHDKLRDYTRHIFQLFKSFPKELHRRVINYDKAVRLRVAARRDLLLTDFSEFSDLHLQWIQNSLQIGSQRNSDVTAADVMFFLDPLAEISLNKHQNEVALRTIWDHPHLFDIVTPINVDRFKQLLVGHPTAPSSLPWSGP
ncbi:hypothetical protein EV121DRAFT_297514 [Schizophyllum commune]